MNSQPSVPSQSEIFAARWPSAWFMHCGMLLTGIGMTLLGPVLPLVMAQWGLRDSQAGLLLSAQFVGMSLGSIAISRELNKSLLTGIFASFAGFAGVALMLRSPAGNAVPVVGSLLFFLAGLGLGQLITSINLIAGDRYRSKRGSALSLLNFSWSLGAVLSPLVAAEVASHWSLFALIGAVACAFLTLGMKAFWESSASVFRRPVLSAPPTPLSVGTETSEGISASVFFSFGVMFFLYGGVETCISGWLTTYTVRYGRHGLSVSETSIFLFWISLTAGRGIASLLLMRMSEEALRLSSLAIAVFATCCLVFADSLAGISAAAVLIGLGLAPCFPATLSLMLRRGPRPRQAALALALAGLGGAVLSWAMGAGSSQTHSLHAALVLPLLSGAALLALCMRSPKPLKRPQLNADEAA